MVDFTAGFEEEVLRPDTTAKRVGLTNKQLRNMEAAGLLELDPDGWTGIGT